MAVELEDLDSIFEVSIHEPFEKIFGSRVIIIGADPGGPGRCWGGERGRPAQFARRADQRGYHSTVGEEAIADAVRAVSRLPRASIWFWLGRSWAGASPRRLRDFRQRDSVIALKMAGSVPDQADLVVTDPSRPAHLL